MSRRLIAVPSIAAALVLSACVAAPPAPPEDEERFAARQLDGIALSVEDFGGQWRASTDEEAFGEGSGESAQGGGPGGVAVEQADPCTWATNWLPDPAQFYTHSWRTYTTGDTATFAQDWIAAIEPSADPAALLATLRDTLSACETTPDPAAQPDGTVTVVPDIHPELGDGSFSYRAEFAHPDYGGVYGAAEVHTMLCGHLWLHLSYIGYDPFVERDALLATMLERAAPLGGCAA